MQVDRRRARQLSTFRHSERLCHAQQPRRRQTLSTTALVAVRAQPVLQQRIPTAAAIANAIYDAIGVRFYDAPITRDRVLDALEKIETETLKLEQRDCL